LSTSKVEEKLKDIAPGSVAIVDSTIDESHMRLAADLFRFMRNDICIYVASNRPATDLVDKLLTWKFDLREALETGKVSVIDSLSRSVGADEIKGVIYVASALELSATQMAIETSIERIDGESHKRWVVLDSISTLLVYNSAGAVLQFLIGRLRVLHISGIILTVRNSVDEKVMSTLRQLCDMVIEL
jgi:archaellum biogenesis ATPase FlaH